MAERDFFRSGDRVTVHGLIRTEGRPVSGRVVCTNRKSKYGEVIVVLCDLEGSEMIETFKEDGSRYIGGAKLTLGWPKKVKGEIKQTPCPKHKGFKEDCGCK